MNILAFLRISVMLRHMVQDVDYALGVLGLLLFLIGAIGGYFFGEKETVEKVAIGLMGLGVLFAIAAALLATVVH